MVYERVGCIVSNRSGKNSGTFHYFGRLELEIRERPRICDRSQIAAAIRSGLMSAKASCKGKIPSWARSVQDAT
jgi:hypothetical protein